MSGARALLVAAIIITWLTMAAVPSEARTLQVGLGSGRAAVSLGFPAGAQLVLPGGDTVALAPGDWVWVGLARAMVQLGRSGPRWVAQQMAEALGSVELPVTYRYLQGSWIAYLGPFVSGSEAWSAAKQAQQAGIPARVVWAYHPEGELTISWRGGALQPVSRVGELVRASGTSFTVDGRQYRGEVHIWGLPDGTVQVINEVDLEAYLRGVVPAEMPAEWPLEALKAQAIAARTYALRHCVAGGRHEGFDLCDGTHCQVYAGAGREHPRTDRAVKDTQGVVLWFGDRLADTVYHAHAGGRTEDAEQIWGSAVPYLRGRPVPAEPPRLWSWMLPEVELLQALARVVRQEVEGPLVEFNVLQWFPSGRVRRVSLVTPSGQYVVSAERLRSAIGATRVRSGFWEVAKGQERTMILGMSAAQVAAVLPAGDPVRITRLVPAPALGVSYCTRQEPLWVFWGDGFGHGVGMSQWGAQGLALDGWTHGQILQFFYPGTRLGPWKGP